MLNLKLLKSKGRDLKRRHQEETSGSILLTIPIKLAKENALN
jgi:hypothetical protein